MHGPVPPKRRWLGVLALAALCGFLFFYGLNAGDLYRTENLRAIVADGFLRSGDWVVPRLYGEPLLTKPPGTYAAIALVSWPFGGVSDWTARLPSALAATATVFLVYWYFGRHLGPRGGLAAACILPLSMVWLDKVPTAEIDAMQVMWVTAAVLFFLRATEEPSPGGLRWWVAALLCVAGGFLTKWTAPAFFYGTALPLLWRRRQLRLLWGRNHLVGLALAAGLCLTWVGLAVAWAGWDTFAETVGREAMQRLSPSLHQEALEHMPANHQGRPPLWAEALLHPVRVFAAEAPWSLLALATLWPGFYRRLDERGRKLWQALHCWLWPNLVFWSVIPEHALRHSLPLFPALAGLAALVWAAWLDSRLTWPLPAVLRPARVLVAVVVLWLAVKVVFVEAVLPARNPNRAPRAKGERLAAVVPADRTLYVFQLKDEGIMFYFGRLRPKGGPPPVRRLRNPADLPSSGEPVYCILDETEFQQWSRAVPASGPASDPPELLLRLSDEQGSPIVLVRVPAGGRCSAPSLGKDSAQ
jgi:4-amino-4-deoxy-L-arabinose transferase-like glycosyltransferase